MKIDNNHPPIKFGKTGVLIVNLGTPDSTNWLDIRKYLKEFLSDKRVIEVKSSRNSRNAFSRGGK